MDHYQTLASNCHQTIESIALVVDDLAAPLAQAAALIGEALLADRKVLACGLGQDAAIAQLFTLGMQGHLHQERPALPAMQLAADGAAVAAVAARDGAAEIYARQVRSLGQPGDVLLCIASGPCSASLLRAIAAAGEREMTVVALGRPADDALLAALHKGDVHVGIRADAPARAVELCAVAVQNLCEFIDHSLFGDNMGSHEI